MSQCMMEQCESWIPHSGSYAWEAGKGSVQSGQLEQRVSQWNVGRVFLKVLQRCEVTEGAQICQCKGAM